MRNRVQSGRNTKNDTHAHLLGIARQLHEFHANHRQTFTPYNSQSVGSGTQLTLPITTGNKTIFLFQKGVTPFARTAPSWKCAFPGRPGMHTIELMVHNQNTHHKLTNFT